MNHRRTIWTRSSKLRGRQMFRSSRQASSNWSSTARPRKRSAEGKYERQPSLATELVNLKVDIIVSGDTPASRAAQNGTTTIPAVFVGVFDPVGGHELEEAGICDKQYS